MLEIRRNYSLKINFVRKSTILLRATDNLRENEEINSKNELNSETENIRRKIIIYGKGLRRDLNENENNRLKNPNKSISDDILIETTGTGIK